jgi:hypothetical protein
MKDQDGKDLIMYGHGQLGAELLAHGLLDELHFAIHPVFVGEGMPLLRQGATAALESTGVSQLGTGVIVVTSRHAVPVQRCIRVREGGAVLDTVAVDRGCFACMLGGVDGRTLFIAAAEWRGMDALISDGPGLSGQLLAAPDQPAPHAGRP